MKARPEPGVEIWDVPEPQVGPGQVLIRVQAASVCGTDLHINNWDAWARGRIHPPRLIGHEFCGVIAEVGPGVEDRHVGQFVASESHVVGLHDPDLAAGLGHVARSTKILGVDVDGGFAPLASVPAANARPTDESISRPVASLQDALGNAVHTVMDGPVEGCTLLITGLGPIGLFAAAVARTLGAARIYATEISPYRTLLGRHLGIDEIWDPRSVDVPFEIHKREELGVDGVLEMSGHPTSVPLALDVTRPGGRISFLGVFPDKLPSFDMNQAIFKGLRMQGVVGRRLWETWDQMQDLLVNRGLDVSPIITHSMHFTEIKKAFEILERGEAGKIVLTFED